MKYPDKNLISLKNFKTTFDDSGAGVAISYKQSENPKSRTPWQIAQARNSTNRDHT